MIWVRSRLVEIWSKTDPSERVSFTFPISAETGATASSVAYAEIAPGGGIPVHFDSANECDLILEGELEYGLEDGAKTIGPGVLIQIPAETKHRVLNRSDSPARLVFFFDSAKTSSPSTNRSCRWTPPSLAQIEEPDGGQIEQPIQAPTNIRGVR